MRLESFLAASACAVFLACNSAAEAPAPRPAASQGRKPPDRLAPGELGPGKVKVFGFVAPRQMRLERRFPDAAHFVGQARPEAVANYVRERVAVERVEMGAGRTVFPRVAIKGGPEGHVFRIEVVSDTPNTRLVIRDITRPPTTPGLSEAERWKKAGLRPDGTQIDRDKAQ
jgi:hypothetical protein